MFTKGKPVGWVDELAVGWCPGTVGGFRGFSEVEWAAEEAVRVGKTDGVGPGDVSCGVRCDGGVEFNAVLVFDDAVLCSAVFVPEWPPTAVLFW